MTYGLKYTSDFDSFQPLLSYRLNIFKKDYIGASSTILLSGNPAIHEWQDEDPKAAIKGSTLKISILVSSIDGLALTNFYSEDDYGWACELRRLETDEVLFQGYLLQDDSQELQVDFIHEIQLTFTDGLGLLKDVTLDQAAVISGVLTNHSVLIGTPPGTLNTITTQDIGLGGLQPGAVFTINDGSLAGTYTVLSISLIPTLGIYDYWIVTNTIIGYTLPYTASIDWIDPYSLTGYVPLIDIYKLCLKATFITCGLNIYSKIYPVGGTNERLLDDTFIQAETFLSSDRWMNCYDILEQINSRFNLSLFQAHGKWNLIRWDELYRYTTNTGATLQYHTYSTDFIYSATSTNSDVWIFKKGDDMEVGVLKSINRANQFVKETFNYVQPESLLCNYNLQDLGGLIQQYDSGLFTIKEYGLNSWYNGPFSPIPDRFIRITIDNDSTSRTYLQELDRNIVIVNSTGSAPQSAKSCDIPLSKDDSIEFNFSFRTSVHQAGPVNTIFAVSITDGIATYYVQNNGSWATTLGFSYSTPNGGDTFDWQSVNIISNPAPINGVVNIYLAEATPNGGTPSADETLFKDLSFTITYFINGSGRVIGHTHTDSQSLDIKNNIDKEIFIDNSPRTSIKGSLYLASYTNLLRDLTAFWEYPSTSYSYPTLGQHTTQEALFSTYKMRSKYEGKYLYINQEDVMLTILSVFVDNQNYNFFRYAPGRMTIDYKNGHADLSLVEIIDSPTGDFVGPFGSGIEYDYLVWAASRLYEFNYLYEKS
jgi:hypothetical protein